MKTTTIAKVFAGFAAIGGALRIAFLVTVVASALAYISAPVFFGIVFLTSGVIATVAGYIAISFILGLLWNVFRLRSIFFEKEVKVE